MAFFRWLARLFVVPGPAPSPAPGPAPDPAPTPPDPPHAPEPPSASSVLVAALNAQRARNGLDALAEDPRLNVTAAGWARAMASRNVLSHGDFSGRISAAFPNTAAAEDIAEGSPTVDSVVALWMGSPPHRENILGRYTAAGAGTAAADDGTQYWCVDFDVP